MLEQDMAQATQETTSVSTQDAETSNSHPSYADKSFTNIKAKKNLQEQFSSVAVKPSHKKFMAVVIVAVLGVVVYFVFFGTTPSQEEKNAAYNKTIADKKEAIIKEAVSLPRTSTQNIPSVSPKLPEPPPLKEPIPPGPPPPIPAIPQPILPPTVVSSPPPPLPESPVGISSVITSPFGDRTAEQKRQATEARRKEGIMVVGGESGGSNSLSRLAGDKKSDKKEAADGSKKAKTSFLGFDDGQLDKDTIAHTSAEQVRATRVPNLDRTIIQGKIIFAILETAINTDLPGTLRAVVARDVYAENGTHILIPKGSRLIGSYDSNIKGGQTRVNVMWDRLIRPDGIDISIGSAGTDPLGRSGVRGQVDSKFWTRLGNAFLVSYIIPIATNKITGVDKQQITTTTTNSGTGSSSITTSGNVNALTMRDSANKFNQIAAQAVQETFPTQTTIIIDQGTRINILVQKDLVFPAQALNNNIVIK